VSRKRKKANEAVPEEILAEGSGPTQDAESLAEAANEALANVPDPRAADDEDVVFDSKSSKRRRTKRTEVTSDEPIVDDEPPVEDQLEATAEAPAQRKRRRREVISDELAVETSLAATTDGDDAAIEASVLDSEVGPELEEAELEAEQVAQTDEQVLEDAVMRAEAEAELGTAEPEAEAGEEDIELGAALPTTAGTMDDLQLKHLVEALIFAADKPVTMQRLRQLTRVSDVKRLEQALATLAQDFADRGIALQQVSGGFQFRTNTHYSTWVQQLIAGRPVRLSRAQLETLAIIAYRQPITRPEVDEIRGVDSSATLRLLMDRSLIRILGKKEDVGRPLLYGTTKEFLDFFSLHDLRELPTLREYSELTAESRKVMSDRLGVGPDGVSEVEDEDEQDGTAVEPQEASVDDLVREFAEHDLGTHVGTAGEDVASDTAASSADGVTMASDDDVALSSGADPVIESAPIDMTAEDSHDISVSASDDTSASASDEMSASPSDEMSASPSDEMNASASEDISLSEAADMGASAPDDPVAFAPDDPVGAAPDDQGASAPDDASNAASDDMTAPVSDDMTASGPDVSASDKRADIAASDHGSVVDKADMDASDAGSTATTGDMAANDDVSASDSLDSTDEPPTD
jgi:segregation and condensation protein B